MAKAPVATRAPITERGVSLLALIAASTNPAPGVLMLTQDEGADEVKAGNAVVDTSNVDGNTAAVSLTDAGKALLASSAPVAAAATRTSATFAIDTGVPMPTGTPTRTRTGGYPFDALEVGQSFHITPKDADDDKEQIMTRMSSSISAARTKFAEKTGEMEAFTQRTYKKDANGKFEKTADGKRIIETEEEVQREVTKPTRDFKAAIVGADDPKGAGVRVWRVA